MDFKAIWPEIHSEVLWLFNSQAQSLELSRGDFVYSQGDSPRGIYFIKSGLVGFTVLSSHSGKEHLLRFFKQGQFFGHRSLFSNEGYHGNAVALEPTKITFIPRSTFFLGIEKDKALLESFVFVLSKELRQCETQHVMILENEILVRVAQSLVYLKDLHPNHNWTRQEIANFCGSTVSTVIKALTELEEKGFIGQNGRSIVVLNREKLISLQD